MARKDLKGFVTPLAMRLAQDMGYTLVDAELTKEGPGRYLRIYVDKDGGFTLDDCERFHRAIQPELEAVEYDFLEVSSPGVDRPLKGDTDYERALGSQVEVRLYKPVDGQKVHAGELTGYDEGALRILTPSGEKAFDRHGLAQVKPVIAFEDDDIGGGEEEP